jgi:hypothetical protein
MKTLKASSFESKLTIEISPAIFEFTRGLIKGYFSKISGNVFNVAGGTPFERA